MATTRSTQSGPCALTLSRNSFCRLTEMTIQPFAARSVGQALYLAAEPELLGRVVLHDGEPVVAHRADARAVLVDEVPAQCGERLVHGAMLEQRGLLEQGRVTGRPRPGATRHRGGWPPPRRAGLGGASRSR